MKKIISVIAMILAFTLLNTVPSYASAKDKLEKLFKHPPAPIFIPIPIPVPTRKYKRAPRHRRDRHEQRRRQYGHYEYREIWISPEYEERWVSGHYDDRCYWREGRYRQVQVRSGYYIEKRVWVNR